MAKISALYMDIEDQNDEEESSEMIELEQHPDDNSIKILRILGNFPSQISIYFMNSTPFMATEATKKTSAMYYSELFNKEVAEALVHEGYKPEKIDKLDRGTITKWATHKLLYKFFITQFTEDFTE